MKKVLPMLAALLALAAVIVFTNRRAGGVGATFPVSRAAELAPAETVAFLHLPDLDRTQARWKENELGVLGSEASPQAADWQRMLQMSLKRMVGNSELAQLFYVATELEKAEPAGLFLAATSLDTKPLPTVVGGLPFRAKRTEVEAAMRALKERLFKRWPGAKAELSNHHGIEIETITCATPLTGVVQEPGPWSRPARRSTPMGTIPPVPPAATTPAAPPLPLAAVHLAFRDDWLFFSTDRALLAETLDRYLAKPGARSLAQLAVFAECQKHGSPEADVVAWASWEPAGRTYTEHLSDFTFPSEADAGNPVQAVLYTCVLAAPRSCDRLYFHLTKPMTAAPLANRSIAVTTPFTHTYGALSFEGLLGDGDWLRQQVWSRTRERHPFLLKQTDAGLAELRAAFGPELAFTLQAGAPGERPALVVALEVRDAAKARKFAEAIARAQHCTEPIVEGEVTRWTWPAGIRFSVPLPSPMVLTKTHLLFANSATAAVKMVENLQAPQGSLQNNSAYTAAISPLTASPAGVPDAMLLFFDTPAYFAQARVRVGADMSWALRKAPSTVDDLWDNWSSGAKRGEIDSFPSKTVAAQFRPGTVSLRTAGPGWLLESNLGVVGNSILLQALQSLQL